MTIEHIHDLAPRLTCRWKDPSNSDLDVEIATQNQRIMSRLFDTHDLAKNDLHSTINITVAEFGQVSEMVPVTIGVACSTSTSQSSLKTSLLSELTRSTDVLDPKFAALRQSIRKLHGNIPGDLEGARKILRGAKKGLNGCGPLNLEEIQRLDLDFSRLAGTIDKMSHQSLRL